MSEQQSQAEAVLDLFRKISDGIEGINRGIAQMRAGIPPFEPLPADEIAQMEADEESGRVVTSHHPSQFLQGFNAETHLSDAEIAAFLASEDPGGWFTLEDSCTDLGDEL